MMHFYKKQGLFGLEKPHLGWACPAPQPVPSQGPRGSAARGFCAAAPPPKPQLHGGRRWTWHSHQACLGAGR